MAKKTIMAKIKNPKNPKTHDALFKWLITSFTEDFFEHYFPDIAIGKYRFIDKEFISKYEALKESLKDDLFLIMEVEIEGKLHEVVIQVEHMSKRKDVSMRIFEYLCYAWLLKRKPVWSIVIYTDDAVWRKPVTNTFWYAFSSKMKKQFCHFDVIKVKAEKSSDLIKKHSLMCKLLALKANDKDTNNESLVYEIYKTASSMTDQLDNDKKLLLEQWVQAYKKTSAESVKKIKKEVNMSFAATTISEHIWNEGKNEGIAEGKLEGKIEMLKEKIIMLKEKITMLEDMCKQKILTKDQSKMMLEPFKQQLKEWECNLRLTQS